MRNVRLGLALAIAAGGFTPFLLTATAASDAAVDFRITINRSDGRPATKCPAYLLTSVFDRKTNERHCTVAARATTDASGHLVFRGVPTSDTTSHFVLARSPEGVSVALMPPKGPELALKLHPVKQILGRVTDSAGKPVAGASVGLVNLNLVTALAAGFSAVWLELPDELRPAWTVRTDDRGEYRYPFFLELGMLSCSVEANGYNPGSVEFGVAPGALLRGQQPSSMQGPQTAVLYRATSLEGLLVSSDPAMPLDGFHLYASGTAGDKSVMSKPASVGADGRFRITGVLPGHVTLRLRVPNTSEWQPTLSLPLEVAEGIAAAGQVVPVTAVRGVRVKGQLVESDTGKGLAGRWLNTQSGEAVVTDGEGRCQFFAPPGPVSVRIFPQGGEYLVPQEGITVSGLGVAGQTVTLDPLRVRKGNSLVIRVVDARGNPVAGATIRDDELPSLPGGNSETDRNGELTLPGRDSGMPLHLSASSREGSALSTEVDPNAKTVTLVVKPEWAVHLSGHVVDDAGQPVANATVQFMGMYGRSGDFLAPWKTDAAGNFGAGNLPPAHQYSATVQAPLHRGAEVAAWKPGAVRSHDFGTIVLKRQDRFVSGIVVDSGGKPVAGALVLNSGDADRTLQSKTGPDGRFRLQGLEVGGCYLTAKAGGKPLGIALATAPSEGVRLELRSPTVMEVETPALKEQRERFAEKLVEQVRADAGGKPERWPDRQRALSLLFLRDPARATEIATRSGPAVKDSFNFDQARAVLSHSPREAVAFVRQVSNRDWRAQDMLDLAGEATRDQGAVILPAAVGAARGVPNQEQQFMLLVQCGDRMEQLGLPGAEALLRECAARATRMGGAGNDGSLRGYTAERLAAVDLSAALALLAPLTDTEERSRWLRDIAVRLAACKPEKALEVLETRLNGDVFADDTTARMCAVAPDPGFADKLLTRIGDFDHSTQVKALLWMGERAERKKNATRSRDLLDRTEQVLTKWTETSTDEADHSDRPTFYWIRAAALAQRLGSPKTGALLARAIASRPVLGSRYDARAEARSQQAQLALAVALVDSRTARGLVDLLIPRIEESKSSPGRDGREHQEEEEFLLAAALVDPPRAESYLAELNAHGARINPLELAEFVLDSRTRPETLSRFRLFESPEVQ